MTHDTIIRTTHVGSLPRSDAIRELLAESDTSKTAEFEEAVSAAVRAVVRKQMDVGIDVANDGEQSRLAYSVDITNRLSGFGDQFTERELPSDLAEYPEYAAATLGDAENVGGPVAEGPIEYVGREELTRELSRFDEAAAAEGVSFADRFHTAPSPGAVLRFTDTEHHESTEAYLFDLAAALATEYETIVDHGATLQIDAPELLAAFTITFADATVAEFRGHVETYVEAINRALRNVPAEDVRLHACWGNYPGPHHHDVALDDVLDLLFETDASGLVVEGANPRHGHEHRTIADHGFPDDWTLYPGVIDVKTNVVEHPELVAERLERFVDAVGDPSRVVAAPDCGFETVLSANAVHPDIAWRKLASLDEGAVLASERL